MVKVKYVYDVHVKTAFVLTWTIQSKICLNFFNEFFAYMYLETWNGLHTPNARWLAYCGLHENL